jgi:hypothetical protein
LKKHISKAEYDAYLKALIITMQLKLEPPLDESELEATERTFARIRDYMVHGQHDSHGCNIV